MAPHDREGEVQITVLGKSPAWQDAGGACSGYLVREGDTAVLLDCGPGVFGKLREVLDYVAVDAVVLSHLHADHLLDLVPFASALAYAPRQQPVAIDPWPGTDHPARPALHGPPGTAKALAMICQGSGMSPEHVATSFALSEYDPSETLEIGPLRLRFGPVSHFVPTFAIEIASSTGSARLAYSADTGPSEALVEFARGADLLLVEATLSQPEPEPDSERGHLTAAEAGRHGARAGVGRVVLTHISDELDAAHAAAEAQRTFGGPAEVARGGAVYEL